MKKSYKNKTILLAMTSLMLCFTLSSKTMAMFNEKNNDFIGKFTDFTSKTEQGNATTGLTENNQQNNTTTVNTENDKQIKNNKYSDEELGLPTKDIFKLQVKSKTIICILPADKKPELRNIHTFVRESISNGKVGSLEDFKKKIINSLKLIFQEFSDDSEEYEEYANAYFEKFLNPLFNKENQNINQDSKENQNINQDFKVNIDADQCNKINEIIKYITKERENTQKNYLITTNKKNPNHFLSELIDEKFLEMKTEAKINEIFNNPQATEYIFNKFFRKLFDYNKLNKGGPITEEIKSSLPGEGKILTKTKCNKIVKLDKKLKENLERILQWIKEYSHFPDEFCEEYNNFKHYVISKLKDYFDSINFPSSFYEKYIKHLVNFKEEDKNQLRTYPIQIGNQTIYLTPTMKKNLDEIIEHVKNHKPLRNYEEFNKTRAEIISKLQSAFEGKLIRSMCAGYFDNNLRHLLNYGINYDEYKISDDSNKIIESLLNFNNNYNSYKINKPLLNFGNNNNRYKNFDDEDKIIKPLLNFGNNNNSYKNFDDEDKIIKPLLNFDNNYNSYKNSGNVNTVKDSKYGNLENIKDSSNNGEEGIENSEHISRISYVDYNENEMEGSENISENISDIDYNEIENDKHLNLPAKNSTIILDNKKINVNPKRYDNFKNVHSYILKNNHKELDKLKSEAITALKVMFFDCQLTDKAYEEYFDKYIKPITNKNDINNKNRKEYKKNEIEVNKLLNLPAKNSIITLQKDEKNDEDKVNVFIDPETYDALKAIHEQFLNLKPLKNSKEFNMIKLSTIDYLAEVFGPQLTITALTDYFNRYPVNLINYTFDFDFDFEEDPKKTDNDQKLTGKKTKWTEYKNKIKNDEDLNLNDEDFNLNDEDLNLNDENLNLNDKYLNLPVENSIITLNGENVKIDPSIYNKLKENVHKVIYQIPRKFKDLNEFYDFKSNVILTLVEIFGKRISYDACEKYFDKYIEPITNKNNIDKTENNEFEKENKNQLELIEHIEPTVVNEIENKKEDKINKMQNENQLELIEHTEPTVVNEIENKKEDKINKMQNENQLELIEHTEPTVNEKENKKEDKINKIENESQLKDLNNEDKILNLPTPGDLTFKNGSTIKILQSFLDPLRNIHRWAYEHEAFDNFDEDNSLFTTFKRNCINSINGVLKNEPEIAAAYFNDLIQSLLKLKPKN